MMGFTPRQWLNAFFGALAIVVIAWASLVIVILAFGP